MGRQKPLWKLINGEKTCLYDFLTVQVKVTADQSPNKTRLKPQFIATYKPQKGMDLHLIASLFSQLSTEGFF